MRYVKRLIPHRKWFFATGLVAAMALAACANPRTIPQTPPATALPDLARILPRMGQPIEKPAQFFQELNGVKHFYLYIEEREHEILKDVKVPVWAFNGEVPGPEIRVQEGDRVAIHLQNTSSQPHSLHLHGMTSVDQSMDGVPATSKAVLPGEEFVYEFTAGTPGTHMYHCHVGTYQHLDMGMYGPLIVEPRNETLKYDQEYTFMLDEWDTKINPLQNVHSRTYDYFTINGKAFPETPAIQGKVGEVVRVRFINAGYATYYMHSHGYAFTVTHADGYPLPQPYQRDVLPIGPGERYDVLLTLREGIFPWHSHQLEQVLNDGEYLGGAALLVIGE